MMHRCRVLRGHQYCLVFTELPGSVVWCLTLIWGNFSVVIASYVSFVYFSFFSWYSYYRYIIPYAVVSKFLNIQGVFSSMFFSLGGLYCIVKLRDLISATFSPSMALFISIILFFISAFPFNCFLESLPFWLHYLMFLFIPGLIIPSISDSISNTCSVSLTFFFFFTFLYALWFFGIYWGNAEHDVLGKRSCGK